MEKVEGVFIALYQCQVREVLLEKAPVFKGNTESNGNLALLLGSTRRDGYTGHSLAHIPD